MRRGRPSAETLQAFQASRREQAGKLDPAAWHLERLQRQVNRRVQALRASGYGSGWFEEWYAALRVKRVHVPTLIAYLNDLRISLDLEA
jgi:hypothetical protein